LACTFLKLLREKIDDLENRYSEPVETGRKAFDLTWRITASYAEIWHMVSTFGDGLNALATWDPKLSYFRFVYGQVFVDLLQVSHANEIARVLRDTTEESTSHGEPNLLARRVATYLRRHLDGIDLFLNDLEIQSRENPQNPTSPKKSGKGKRKT
jgi:hypothetical protein